MNGYLSPNSSLLSDNMKHSFKAKQVDYAIFDLNILTNSPLRLRKSGLGDSICSSSVRADMLLSHYIKGTHYNAEYFKNNFLNFLEEELFAHSNKLHDKKIVKILTQLLIISGENMMKAGDSTPASQGEHLIAHLYEILSLNHDKDDKNNKNNKKNFHGEEIAVTCYFTTKIQEKFLKMKKITLKDKKIDSFDFLPEKIQKTAKKEFLKKGLKNIENINLFLEKNLEKIQTHILENFLNAKKLQKILDRAEINYHYKKINWNKDIFTLACKNAFLIRNRFTFLDLQHYAY